MEADAAVAHGLDRRPRQLVHVAEPLERDQRLDPPPGAVRVRHVVRVRAACPTRAPPRAARPPRRRAASSTSMPRKRSRRRVGDAPVLADHRHLLEAVPAADLEVGRVVPGRDLQRAGAELGIHVLVGDDRQPPAHQRQDRRLADQARVALVARVHRDRRVGQHRLRAHGGHGHRARARLERVVDRVERVLDRALLDLEVGDRGAQARVPVDHVVVAVDEPLLVQAHEHQRHGARVGVVHREALVVVVERGAQRAGTAR